jgi:hypothetical protein
MPICIKDYATPKHLLSRTPQASAGPKFTSVPVHIIIGVDGRARNIHVIRASAEQREHHSGTDRVAIQAIHGGGRPVEVATGVTLGF